MATKEAIAEESPEQQKKATPRRASPRRNQAVRAHLAKNDELSSEEKGQKPRLPRRHKTFSRQHIEEDFKEGFETSSMLEDVDSLVEVPMKRSRQPRPSRKKADSHSSHIDYKKKLEASYEDDTLLEIEGGKKDFATKAAPEEAITDLPEEGNLVRAEFGGFDNFLLGTINEAQAKKEPQAKPLAAQKQAQLQEAQTQVQLQEAQTQAKPQTAQTQPQPQEVQKKVLSETPPATPKSLWLDQDNDKSPSEMGPAPEPWEDGGGLPFESLNKGDQNQHVLEEQESKSYDSRRTAFRDAFREEASLRRKNESAPWENNEWFWESSPHATTSWDGAGELDEREAIARFNARGRFPERSQDRFSKRQQKPQQQRPLGFEQSESFPEAPANFSEAPRFDEAEDLENFAKGTPSSKRRGRRGGRGHTRKVDMDFAPNFGEEEVQRPLGKRRMYISILPGEQVEVAITNNGILEEYYLDMLHQKKIKGNIYRGVIHNIDTNLQAAFVDFGTDKNGFLQIDEIHPEYYIEPQESGSSRRFPPIQKVLRLGQEVLVQVVKEPNGSKGAFLTTWISLAGRFLVLTPGQEQIGISRKVDDEQERARLRELMTGIDPGDDLGVIVRTVSAGVTRATLRSDLLYLKRTWNDVRTRATEVIAPACVYKEPGLPERAVRDYLTEDVCEIWVDNSDIAARIRETVALLFPNKRDLVRQHTDTRHSMWERFNLRRQLDQIYSREVLMPSGGRLVFDQTEALMAIDVNSGKISGKGNFEAMAYKTNMEAAETIARQLKLRDVGGQVVIDFIEMKERKHVSDVERLLRNSMRLDRARHDILHMSSFGLLELVRQRTGTSAISISMEPCPVCGGTGLRRNLEWQSLHALRDLGRLLRTRVTSPCRYELPQELGLYLLNHKRDSLKELEVQYDKEIEIVLKV